MSRSLQRQAGDKGAGRPFPLHPKSPPKLLRFAPDNPQTRVLRLTKPNTILDNHPASVASLRQLFAFTGTPFGFPLESSFAFTGIPRSRQSPVKLFCLSVSIHQLVLAYFPSVTVKNRNLLPSGMEITPYNSHEGFS